MVSCEVSWTQTLSLCLPASGLDGQLVIRPLMEKVEAKTYEAALRKVTFPHVSPSWAGPRAVTGSAPWRDPSVPRRTGVGVGPPRAVAGDKQHFSPLAEAPRFLCQDGPPPPLPVPSTPGALETRSHQCNR